MSLNQGYSYREQLGPRVRGLTALAYLCTRYSHSSEAEWKARFERGEVELDGVPARGEEALRSGQFLCWHRPPWQEEEVPRNWELLLEDASLLAVIKPSGLPTMPSGGYLENTLMSFVRERFPEATPLHRLGRATSGLVLFARTPRASPLLFQLWRERSVEKRYRALAGGVAGEPLYEITTPIGLVPHPRLGWVHGALASGKESRSTARVLERREAETLFEIDLHTGRPEQIRIHLAAIGHPLVGDPLYGPGGLPRADEPGLPGDGGYLLHADRLVFTHPVTGARVELCAPPPAALELQSPRLPG